jgi:rubrerythrin
VGRFYSDLADRFRARLEAAELFRQLANDEEEHARTFEFLRSVASRMDEDVVVAPSFYGNLDRLRRGLEKAAVALPDGTDEAALKDAVGMAILVESTTLERDKAAFARVDDREFRNLLNALVVADEGHRRELEALRASLPKTESGDAPTSRQAMA